MTTGTPSLRAFDQLAQAKRQRQGTPVPQLPLGQIAPLTGQPRQSMDPVALAELAESIKAYGVIQPIIVIARKQVAENDPVRYGIVCGERRYHAARLAGMESIPALIRDYEVDEVAMLALLENLQREDLTPLEEGEYLAQLKQKHGFTEEQLGERLGKSRDYIHMRVRLLNLQPDLIAAWKESTGPAVFDALTPSHAILLNQVGDVAARRHLTEAVLAGGVTVAETRRRVDRLKPAKASLPREAAQIVTSPSGGPPPSPPPGPRLSLADLAMHALLAPLFASGATEVALRDLELALKQDLAWVRQIAKDGLVSG